MQPLFISISRYDFKKLLSRRPQSTFSRSFQQIKRNYNRNLSAEQVRCHMHSRNSPVLKHYPPEYQEYKTSLRKVS